MARLLKFNNEVVYEHLLTPEVPFELDYCEVVFSLCDVMCRIYAMFLEEVRNALQYNSYRQCGAAAAAADDVSVLLLLIDVVCRCHGTAVQLQTTVVSLAHTACFCF